MPNIGYINIYFEHVMDIFFLSYSSFTKFSSDMDYDPQQNVMCLFYFLLLTLNFYKIKTKLSADCGHIHGRLAPEKKPACGGRHIHGRFTPKSKLACGPSGHIHGRFTPKSKPACSQWTCIQALRSRKVSKYTGASRPKVSRPAAGNY